mgnify:CR=1 FL=1
MKQRHFGRFLSVVLTLVMISGILGACSKEPPFDPTDLSVRDYVGENGIVTAANPYASKVGLDVLKAGGNAFDAAVAVAFAISVAEPDATGFGGGGLMLSYNVKTKESKYYNFREFASFSYDGSKTGAASKIAVPTQLAGLARILQDTGTKSLQEILAPSIALARDGVTITPELASNISQNLEKILSSGDAAIEKAFTKDGLDPYGTGDKLIQPDLAKTLQMVSDNGIESFYTGEFAEKLAQSIQDAGGYVTVDDLKYAMDNYPKSGSALTGSYGDYSILTCSSPSTGGTMLLEMLNMLEQYKKTGSLTDLGHNSAEYVNLLATVEQLAYGDKEKYLADTAFVEAPVAGLLNKEYAASRLAKYKAGKAYLGTGLSETEQPFGDPTPYQDAKVTLYPSSAQESHFSTTSFSVADREGNLVTFTQTINNFFGSGVVMEGAGFFLNDQMRDFSAAGSINEPKAGKQPASYMMPTVLLKNGEPYATLGTPGGTRIPSAMLQVILNMVEFDMDIQSAINAPRFFCFTTNETNRSSTTKDILIEKALSNLSAELTAMGYAVNVQGMEEIDSYLGGVQGIQFTNEGKLHGAADPRRDGKAFGY